MKNIASIALLAFWLGGWSIPLLSSPCPMECCKPQGRETATSSVVSPCSSHCGQDGCCSWQESGKSEPMVKPALLTVNPNEFKNLLAKIDNFASSNRALLKEEQSIHLSREPTLGSKWLIATYLKHKHFLI